MEKIYNEKLKLFYNRKYKLYDWLQIIFGLLSSIFFINLILYVFEIPIFQFERYPSSTFGKYWGNLIFGLTLVFITYKGVVFCNNKKEKYDKLLSNLK